VSETPSGRLTVVLATWNGARWLPELLDSIASQTLHPTQLIILDDCSTDETWELVRSAALPGVQIIVGRHETNHGVIATFEQLLTMVSTEYFALCDQDDVWLPDKLEISMRQLESSGADLVYTDLRVVDRNLNELAPSMWHLCNVVPVTAHPVVSLIIKNSVTGCTVVGRTSMLKKALPLPPGIPMHDWWLGIMAASCSGIVPLKSSTVLYRQHGSNATGAYGNLWTRVARSGQRLGVYLDDRLAARCALISGLRTHNVSGRYVFLSWFYRQPALLRFIINPAYLAYTATHASALGIRNLVVDWIVTCAPVPALRGQRGE
jgi:glycosyltransferase involved in cell wall biosynthesis